MKKGATPKDSIIVVVHVDDLLSVGKREKLDRLLCATGRDVRVEYIETGKSVLFLGDHITKYRCRITLKSKDAHVDNMLAMPSMEGCRPTDTPMVRKEPAANGDGCLKDQIAETYRSVRGHLDVFQETSFRSCTTQQSLGRWRVLHQPGDT